MTCKERIFTIQYDRPDASFDKVGVKFDAAVIEETREPVLVVESIPDGICGEGLAGEARELVLEPGFEIEH